MKESTHIFAESELIINEDGSIFHLHLLPEQVAEKVILVGDPSRVDAVAQFLENITCNVCNREFRSVTGEYKGKAVTVISTGIGCDNVDIVINELDALHNIDFQSRTQKEPLRTLDIVRIGTCGGIQTHTPVGSIIASEYGIGFDGLLNYYAGRNEVCEQDMEKAFVHHMQWSQQRPAPYIVQADTGLTQRIAGNDMVLGITVSCGGFYGPQGRALRTQPSDPTQNEKLESFAYDRHEITNFEMESSALFGLSKLLGHRAATCCLVLANRKYKHMNTDYKTLMNQLILKVLERI